MIFQVTGVSQDTGEEQTLRTDVATVAEALERAAGYGILVTEIRTEDNQPVPLPAGFSQQPQNPTAAVAANNQVRRRTMSTPARIGNVLVAILVLAVFIARLVLTFSSGRSSPNSHTLTPGELQQIQELTKPKMPDWAEAALRDQRRAIEEVKNAPYAPMPDAGEEPTTQPAFSGSITERFFTGSDGREMHEIAERQPGGPWLRKLYAKTPDGKWVREK